MSDNLQYLPTSIVYQMIRTKKPENFYRLKYKEKSYQLSVFEFTKTDLAKIYRVDGSAAMFVGSMSNKGMEYDLHAKSISIDEIKKVLKSFPRIAVLSVNRGKGEEKKFVPVVSVAFKDMNLIDSLKRETLKKYLANSVKPKDSQRNALYRWESRNLVSFSGKAGDKAIALGKLNSYAKKIIAIFNLPMDKIHVTNQTSRSDRKLGNCRVIKDDISAEHPNFAILNIHDSTLNTLVHEIAHLVCYFKFKTISSHGAEYTGVYAYLLSKVFGVDVKEVIQSMKDGGLKVTKFVGPTKALKL